ncbi:MAG: recombinase family protein [Erythrobacter cryptus]
MRAEGLSHAAIARQLESEGLPSLSGKPWTGESLRKLLKSC